MHAVLPAHDPRGLALNVNLARPHVESALPPCLSPFVISRALFPADRASAPLAFRHGDIDDDVLQSLVLCIFFKPAAVYLHVYLHALDIQKLLQYPFHGAVLLPVFCG